MMEPLHPDLQKLVDESAIRHLLALYPRALDRQDYDLLASLFHPDAIDEHGHYNGPAAGFVQWMKEHDQPGVYWTHHNGTQIIELDGDVACVETYTIALCRQGPPGTPAHAREIFLRVRYLDRVEKREGVWKIAHRRVVYSPCRVANAAEAFPLPDTCIPENAAGKDPTYNW